MTTTTVAALKPFHSWPVSIAMFAIATVGEFVGLSGWYYYHARQPMTAFIILWIGFLIERAMVVIWLQLPRKVITPSGNLGPLYPLIGLVTVAEIVVWTLWIRLIETNQMPAGIIVLVVGIHLVHSYEVALIKRRDFGPTLRDRGVIVLTALECLGGTVGLHFATSGRPGLGAAVMFFALLTEHIFQVLGLKYEEQAATPQPASV